MARGPGAAAAADGRRRGNELPRRNFPPTKMTAIEAVILIGLLMLCLGLLLGNLLTVQALDRQYRRLAIERRELNEWHRRLREISLRCT
ncbi:MAG: hypothetical protein ACRDS9_14810 [Pseudonocardiaceae bacterium]